MCCASVNIIEQTGFMSLEEPSDRTDYDEGFKQQHYFIFPLKFQLGSLLCFSSIYYFFSPLIGMPKLLGSVKILSWKNCNPEIGVVSSCWSVTKQQRKIVCGKRVDCFKHLPWTFGKRCSGAKYLIHV